MRRHAFFIAGLFAGCTVALEPLPEICPPDQCTVCGDGEKLGIETCDDGNVTSNDGCSAACAIEAGWECSADAPSFCKETCGDKKRVGSETCDDGDREPGDGCDARCRLEDHWTCDDLGSCELCGNGELRGEEQCDDGDSESQDGCSGRCRIEVGWACTSTSTAPTTCKPICGDGLELGNETCDDANDGGGDGCSDRCQIESGWICLGAGVGSCSPECGDGLIRGDEQCDDDNAVPGDGCSGLCRIEDHWSCDGAEPTVCVGICPDGFVRDEACDDDNMAGGDGCDSSCELEEGWDCAGEPSMCVGRCGDGIRVGMEGCDDGNRDPGDGCTAACVVEAGWRCSGDRPTRCTASCGDRIIQGVETCDDGNTRNGDGCNSACQVEGGCGCAGAVCECYLTEILSLSLGASHTCATLASGGVRCWGLNDEAQLGVAPALSSTTTPVAVIGFSGTASAARGLGRRHSCVWSAGLVSCWGGNLEGQLGNAALGRGTPMPTVVPGLTGVIEVALGTVHSCALVSDGTVRCWGAGASGRLGDGSSSGRATPVRVRDLTGAKAIAGGEAHNCVLLADGAVRCWGANDAGQLGDGSNADRATAELIVVAVDDALQIAAGGKSTCVTVEGGTARCWGKNERGQLGDGTTLDRNLPSLVRGVSNVAQVAVGATHGCARHELGGTIWCWGENDRGQLGDGTRAQRVSASPVVGLGTTPAIDIVAGPQHTCAILADRTARCWGANQHGQLGNGTTAAADTPQPVLR